MKREKISGYSMNGSRIIFEKIDKTEKYNELIELHTLILINITCLKEIFDFLFCKWNFQLKETFFQLLMIYCTIWILVYKKNNENTTLSSYLLNWI